MKIKVDSCISTNKEFYAIVYPESDSEVDRLVELITNSETVPIEVKDELE